MQGAQTPACTCRAAAHTGCVRRMATASSSTLDDAAPSGRLPAYCRHGAGQRTTRAEVQGTACVGNRKASGAATGAGGVYRSTPALASVVLFQSCQPEGREVRKRGLCRCFAVKAKVRFCTGTGTGTGMSADSEERVRNQRTLLGIALAGHCSCWALLLLGIALAKHCSCWALFLLDIALVPVKSTRYSLARVNATARYNCATQL